MNNEEDIESYKNSLEDYSFGQLIEELIDLKISNASLQDLTEKSKNNLKIGAIRRELNDKFLRKNIESDPPKEDNDFNGEGVSKISDIVS